MFGLSSAKCDEFSRKEGIFEHKAVPQRYCWHKEQVRTLVKSTHPSVKFTNNSGASSLLPK